MKVLNIGIIESYYKLHNTTEKPLKTWLTAMKYSKFDSPQDIKNQYKSASIINNELVVFNIKGNRHRLVVKVKYENEIMLIKWVGLHKDYDKLDLK
jgi:mRNA interferase HigB